MEVEQHMETGRIRRSARRGIAVAVLGWLGVRPASVLLAPSASAAPQETVEIMNFTPPGEECRQGRHDHVRQQDPGREQGRDLDPAGGERVGHRVHRRSVTFFSQKRDLQPNQSTAWTFTDPATAGSITYTYRIVPQAGLAAAVATRSSARSRRPCRRRRSRALRRRDAGAAAQPAGRQPAAAAAGQRAAADLPGAARPRPPAGTATVSAARVRRCRAADDRGHPRARSTRTPPPPVSRRCRRRASRPPRRSTRRASTSPGTAWAGPSNDGPPAAPVVRPAATTAPRSPVVRRWTAPPWTTRPRRPRPRRRRPLRRCPPPPWRPSSRSPRSPRLWSGRTRRRAPRGNRSLRRRGRVFLGAAAALVCG